jgi:hypothetical protein
MNLDVTVGATVYLRKEEIRRMIRFRAYLECNETLPILLSKPCLDTVHDTSETKNLYSASNGSQLALDACRSLNPRCQCQPTYTPRSLTDFSRWEE